jgi:hypothetical protein
MELITRGRVPNTTDTIAITSIPQNYTHLQLVVSGSWLDSSAQKGFLKLQFNGDTNNNYHFFSIRPVLTKNFYEISKVNGNLVNYIGVDGAHSLTAESDFMQGAFEIFIFNYSNSGVNKHTLSKGHTMFIGNDSTEYTNMGHSTGTWEVNSAITSLRLEVNGGTYSSNTQFSLYGYGI